jgi:hypothetical protein
MLNLLEKISDILINSDILSYTNDKILIKSQNMSEKSFWHIFRVNVNN